MAKGKKKKRKEKKQAPAPKATEPKEASPAAKPAEPKQAPPGDPEKATQAPGTETADSEKSTQTPLVGTEKPAEATLADSERPTQTPPLEAAKPAEAKPGEATPAKTEKPTQPPAPDSAAPKRTPAGPAPAAQPGQDKQPKQDKPPAPKRAEAAAAATADTAAPAAPHPLLTLPGAARPWSREDALPLLLLAALAAVLLWGPFQRGLFFDTEILIVITATFSLFTVWCGRRWFRGEHGWLSRPVDWAILLLAVLYFTSFLWAAVAQRAALLEFFRMASYFAVYLMVYDLARQRDRGPLYLNIILHLLLLSGLAVAVGGLGSAAGSWDIVGAVSGRRIYTSLQYPNTAAAYLLASYFLCLGLNVLCPRSRWRLLYAIPGTILLIVFIFTFSRGAWIMLPPLALLILILMGRAHLARSLTFLAATGLGSGLVLAPLDGAIQNEATGAVWLLTIGAALVAVVLSTAGEGVSRLSPRGRLAAAGGVLATFVLGAVFLGPTISPHLARPLALETAADAKASDQYLEQRVERLAPGQEHTLTLEVNAFEEGAGEIDPAAGDEASADHGDAGEETRAEARYAWRLRVQGYDLDNEEHTLLDEAGAATDGWEEHSFSFRPDRDIQRLDVRLYNRYPGSGFAARNVILTSPEGEASLGFTLHRWLPDQIYGRLQAIGAGERDAQLRFMFINDATRIARDHPLLGTGGGGWEALYPLYQEVDYTTREVHSHPFQVWVETGTPGLVALLAAWVLMGWALLRGVFRSRDPASRALAAALLVATATLAAHSIIDFNFSLGIVSIFFYVLLGAARSQEEWHPPFPERLRRRLPAFLPPWTGTAALLLLSLALTFNAAQLTSGHWTGYRAASLVHQGQLQEAIPVYEQAIARDPYRAENRSVLAGLYEYAADMEANEDIAPQLRGQALEQRRKAYEIQPYSVQYTEEYALALMRTGQIDEGLELVHRLIELRPKEQNSYLQAANAHLSAAEHLRDQGEEKEAEKHLWEVLALEAELAQVQEDTSPLYPQLGRAHYLAGEYLEALVYLEQVDKEDESWATALMYRAAALHALEQADEAKELLEQLPEEEEEALRQLYEELLAAQS